MIILKSKIKDYKIKTAYANVAKKQIQNYILNKYPVAWWAGGR